MKEGFEPSMMTEEPAAEMIRETYNVLRGAMDAGVADSVMPPAMVRKLDDSLFLFSGFKTAQELKEASSLLRKADGSVKAFTEFYTDVRRIDTNYNVNYLEAEYNFAISSSQMAASWAEVQEGGDRYDLQYRTAGDSHVREEHRALNGITLPPDDPFWQKYYPPNGWNCRCTVRQVRKGKFRTSDPDEAMRRGDEATDSPKQKIFRFNPGIDHQLFPPHHPYYKLSETAKEKVSKAVEEVRKEVEGDSSNDKSPQTHTINLQKRYPKGRITNDRVKEIMREYANLFPDDYNGGLISVEIKQTDDAFMSNCRFKNRSGNLLTIYSHKFEFFSGRNIVEFNPAKETRDAFAAIRKKENLTFQQEYAMESLWHETLHAKAKGWVDRTLRTQMSVMQMETVNQFVARNTYNDFIARFGGKVSHQDEVLKKGYGYDTWIRNFRAILQHHKIDETQTMKFLREKLLNEPYEKLGEYTSEFLKEKGVENAKNLMEALDLMENDFDKLLQKS